MKRVYIASPYTKGDTAANVRRSIDAFNQLIELGFVPFSPLLSHFIEMIHPMSWEKWLEWDFAWLDQCDYILRLAGESKGADMEVARAIGLGKPVFYSIDELMLYANTDKKIV